MEEGKGGAATTAAAGAGAGAVLSPPRATVVLEAAAADAVGFFNPTDDVNPFEAAVPVAVFVPGNCFFCTGGWT